MAISSWSDGWLGVFGKCHWWNIYHLTWCGCSSASCFDYLYRWIVIRADCCFQCCNSTIWHHATRCSHHTSIKWWLWYRSLRFRSCLQWPYTTAGRFCWGWVYGRNLCWWLIGWFCSFGFQWWMELWASYHPRIEFWYHCHHCSGNRSGR